MQSQFLARVQEFTLLFNRILFNGYFEETHFQITNNRLNRVSVCSVNIIGYILVNNESGCHDKNALRVDLEAIIKYCERLDENGDLQNITLNIETSSNTEGERLHIFMEITSTKQ